MPSIGMVGVELMLFGFATNTRQSHQIGFGVIFLCLGSLGSIGPHRISLTSTFSLWFSFYWGFYGALKSDNFVSNSHYVVFS
jgi:hypothetical protein